MEKHGRYSFVYLLKSNVDMCEGCFWVKNQSLYKEAYTVVTNLFRSLFKSYLVNPNC